MNKYKKIAVVGEGSYGIVTKCKHRISEEIVAVKKFLETDENATIRTMALREIRTLKRLKHVNLVTMLEVFRCMKQFHLVFEFVDRTVLNELERHPNGLGNRKVRERIYQLLRGVNFLHEHNIIHRDIKPENVLISNLNVVKLCDFGFARIINKNYNNNICTEYVATRWYRAPELLVGEQNYGPAIDIWAVGCLFAELMTGDALFPGKTDIDQLYLILQLLEIRKKEISISEERESLKNMIKTANTDSCGLYKMFAGHCSELSVNFLSETLKLNPQQRYTSRQLLQHDYFFHDNFLETYIPKLKERILHEIEQNTLLRDFKEDLVKTMPEKEEYYFSPSMSNNNNDNIIGSPPAMPTHCWKITLAETSLKKKTNVRNCATRKLT